MSEEEVNKSISRLILTKPAEKLRVTASKFRRLHINIMIDMEEKKFYFKLSSIIFLFFLVLYENVFEFWKTTFFNNSEKKLNMVKT